MQKNDFASWLTQWFKEKIGSQKFDLNDNFFSTQLLNSFLTLELVTDIESFFKISLPDSALTDSRFHSINGVAAILVELHHTKD